MNAELESQVEYSEGATVVVEEEEGGGSVRTKTTLRGLDGITRFLYASLHN